VNRSTVINLACRAVAGVPQSGAGEGRTIGKSASHSLFIRLGASRLSRLGLSCSAGGVR
jgi:hypothetical protein